MFTGEVLVEREGKLELFNSVGCCLLFSRRCFVIEVGFKSVKEKKFKN